MISSRILNNYYLSKDSIILSRLCLTSYRYDDGPDPTEVTIYQKSTGSLIANDPDWMIVGTADIPDFSARIIQQCLFLSGFKITEKFLKIEFTKLKNSHSSLILAELSILIAKEKICCK